MTLAEHVERYVTFRRALGHACGTGAVPARLRDLCRGLW